MDRAISEIISRFSRSRGSLLPILSTLHEALGCLSEDAVREVGRFLDLSENDVYSVASFYSSFHFKEVDTNHDNEHHDITPRPGETRTVLRNAGRVRPEVLDDYTAQGGYTGLEKALGMTRSELVRTLNDRPGIESLSAPPHQQGESCLVCNALGPIGLILLENDPHSVLEGMVIGALASGAGRGLLCVGSGQTLARDRAGAALMQAGERGLLPLPIDIVDVPEALILREEAALAIALEGRRAVPSMRAEGETMLFTSAEECSRMSALFAGSEEVEFAGYGDTRICILSGDIARPGLVEVPGDMTLRQIVFDLGGGLQAGRGFKAVSVGWPTGEWLSESYLDQPVTVATSADLVVAGDDKCAVDLARETLCLLEKESCGKCVFCREGTMQMAEILTEIAEGRGRPGDIDLLIDLGGSMKKGSLCGLGRAAADPVVSTIRDFRDEYEEKLRR